MANGLVDWFSGWFGNDADSKPVASDAAIRPAVEEAPNSSVSSRDVTIADTARDMPRMNVSWLLVQNWSHPFKQKGYVNILHQVTQLATAKAGYFPLGASGLWHGGIHFDSCTGSVLDQSSVSCIADGEVVAYLIDMDASETEYVVNKAAKKCQFSRNFVLVRHRMEAPEIDGSDESPPSLIFYSLYMHLQDGSGYRENPSLDRPAFWQDKGDYIVSPSAKDKSKKDSTVLGANVRNQVSKGVVIDHLRQGSRIQISGGGEYRKLENPSGPTGLLDDSGLRGYVRFDQLVPLDDGEFRAKDQLIVYSQADGKGGREGVRLPKDTQVQISGEGSLRKLESVAQYVYFGSLRSLLEPCAYNEIVVLEKPFPIKAGGLIGHVGNYQDCSAAEPEARLHLEVFTAEDAETFIDSCRKWSKGLSPDLRNWLKFEKGTVVVAHRESFSKSNPPVVGSEHPVSASDLLLPKAILDGLPPLHKITVPATEGCNACNWYYLEDILNDASNKLLKGWVKEEVGVTPWVSPWEWDGYEVITDYSTSAELMAASLRSEKRLAEEQLKRYGPMADAGDKSKIKHRLSQLVDRDGNGRVTANELRSTIRTPAGAQALSKLVVSYESEWHYAAYKWDALDEVLGHSGSTPHVNWLAEKERIKQLSWWDDVAAKLWLPADGRVYHFNPIGLLVNLGLVDDNDLRWLKVRRGQVTFDAEGNDYPGNRYFSRMLHWPGGKSGVTLGRGYDMKHRAADDILFDLIAAGVEYEAAKRFSEGANLFGPGADEFVRRNKTAYGALTLRQQHALFEDIVYPVYEASAKSRYRVLAAKMKSASPSWEELDSKIRDIAVDFTYHQGSIFESQFPYIISNDRQSLAGYILEAPKLKQYEGGRRRAIYLRGKDK
ncbi:hypothetical protein ACIF8Z_04875 [Pseudomonas promysalinigenes]|uniref:hypothetical protein n=1 Tax=Pseudomonas promysalinigenes TaxID=485898 RepID=UPI0037CA8919